MEAYPLGTRRVAQIGIIVRDIEAASAAWAKLLGCEVPKWHWTEAYEESRTEYLGQPTPARAKLAFFQLDNLAIELIEPDEHPSTWRGAQASGQKRHGGPAGRPLRRLFRIGGEGYGTTEGRLHRVPQVTVDAQRIARACEGS